MWHRAAACSALVSDKLRRALHDSHLLLQSLKAGQSASTLAASLPQGYFEVERVLDSKVVAGEVVYLVRWRGHGEEHDSWEPRDNLSECLELVEDYDFANSERWLYEP